jgi:hypothetical protein
VASTYTGERRTQLEALAELLPGQGLASRMVAADEAVLWVWHPRTGQQTLVFATPSRDGWLFLWSSGGQGSANDLRGTARALAEALAEPR